MAWFIVIYDTNTGKATVQDFVNQVAAKAAFLRLCATPTKDNEEIFLMEAANREELQRRNPDLFHQTQLH